MGSFGEFRQQWRPLAAAFVGMGSALSLNSYILSVFAPYLIEEFGWSRSQWAMLGLVQLLMMVCLPVAGRLADLYGVRRVAAVGALSFPVFLVAITLMPGSLEGYLAIYVAQTIVCSTTTSTVYSRVIATSFKLRRGVALGIAGSSPPLISALGAPLITAFVATHGWRAGYLAVAVFCAVCAVLTLLLLQSDDRVSAQASPEDRRKPGSDYRTIFAMPVFWILFTAIFLANLPFSLAISQLKLVVLDQGLDDATAALMVSTFAVGSIMGRIVSGFALDALPSHLVAAVGFGLPFIGLVLLALPFDTVLVVGLAILLIGVSFGGEGDVLPYMVTRYFDLRIFSTVSGLLSAAVGSAMALGNALLSLVLTETDSFHGYLIIAAAGAFIGAAMFLMLGMARFRPALKVS